MQWFGDVDVLKYVVVFFVGGYGVMWDFFCNVDVEKVMCMIYEVGGVVGVVCYGLVVLVDVKFDDGIYFVVGKNLSVFMDEEEWVVQFDCVVFFLFVSMLKQCGVFYDFVLNWIVKVVVDGWFVIGQNLQLVFGVGVVMCYLLFICL